MIQLQDLLDVTGGVVHVHANIHEFADFCYDSRLAAHGQLFLAVRTERRDGHGFIADAIRGGCTGVLCEQPPEDSVDATVIVVPDVRQALQLWASSIVRRYHPTVVGVTGSVGKTSTKRTIATLLEGYGPTFASRRSFNSLFGLPIALGRIEPQHQIAVLEMGVDRFGEMRRLVELFPPQIAVITNVAPTHLRYLRDEEHIAAEKSELVAALPQNGWAILNADDFRVAAMAKRTTANKLWYGIAGATKHGIDDASQLLQADTIKLALDGTRFDLIYNNQRLQAYIPLLGRHHVYTALAAVGVALSLGMSFQHAVDRLQLCERQAGRLNPLSGVNSCTVLDDTYNASPASAHAALDTLAALPAARRIVVFGDMLELGDAAVRLHQEVGQHALQVAQVIVTKGDLAVGMQLTGQRAASKQIATNTVAETVAAVRSQLQPGDLVLVKGSAEARMEQVVAGLLAPHVNSTQMLVRQERAFEMLRIADPGRPTWIEIDLDAIASNMRLTQKVVGSSVRVLATLKADAYGHGAIRVARTLLRAGAWGFAVATLSEAQALRDADIEAPILILGYTPAWQVRDAIRQNVRLTVFDHDVAREISLAAQELQIEAIVHVKVDTGMARLGLHPNDVLELLQLLQELPGVQVEGIFTHFATADSADERFAREQLRRFTQVLAQATQVKIRPPLAHAANSAAILRFPEAHFDLVRPGLSLYGLAPSTETPLPPGFRPALSFKTEVAQVKSLPAGTPISYGGTFVTVRESRIATIPVGYADGFRRSPRWKHVLVKGNPVPIVGRVAMDYTMLDVTDVAGVRAGDEVVLIGVQGNARITADDVAEWLETINYEVVAAIMPRVPRTT